jgi:hypothetical protein
VSESESIHGMYVRDDIAYKVDLYERAHATFAHLKNDTDPEPKKAGGATRGLGAMLTIAADNAERDGHDWEVRVFEKSADQIRVLVHADRTVSHKNLPGGDDYKRPAKRLGERPEDEPAPPIDLDVVGSFIDTMAGRAS